jgi:hypothetical protein
MEQPQRYFDAGCCKGWHFGADEFAWPETEDGELDFLRPGREAGE